MNEKILCVDDDIHLLDAYARRLRKRFSIRTALGAEEALVCVREKGPYAVIVADMRMPGMDGVQLLTKIKHYSPDTVRIMLTGHADFATALNAVNDGHIFRFLTKPCPFDVLDKTLEAGLQQHRLITAEKELLSRTLTGTVKILTDVLALANSAAYGRTSRVYELAVNICSAMGLTDGWEIEVAAMLSQLGCVAVSKETLEKIERGDSLSEKEAATIRNHPNLGRKLIESIPRMEAVAEIIGHQNRPYHRQSRVQDAPFGTAIPLGSRILKAALDFDGLVSTGISRDEAMRTMRQRDGWYDPTVIEALDNIISRTCSCGSDIQMHRDEERLLRIEGDGHATGELAGERLRRDLSRAGSNAEPTVSTSSSGSDA